MKIDALPCYGCAAAQPKWRGPKLGWLCLDCFSKTEPIVRLGAEDTSAVMHGDHTPLVTRTSHPGGGMSWALHIVGPRSTEPTEQHHLGTDIDAEEAVNEAKWLLNKRAHSRFRPT